MLNGIHLVDFGNHRNTRLTFGSMTALVGQNGSGKTTVMRAISELRSAIMARNRAHLDIGLTRRGGSQATLFTSFLLSRDDRRYDIGLVVDKSAEWTVRPRPIKQPTPWIPDGRLPDEVSSTIVDDFEEMLENPSFLEPEEIGYLRDVPLLDWSSCYFKTSARSLQSAAIANEEMPSINDDGSNLAWALSYLMTAEPERFTRILEALREVVPVVKRIRSRPTKLTRLEKRTITINKQEHTFDEEREVMGQELIFDMKSGDGLPATSVSEGTLVALAVLTLVYGSDADLVMLDDVELGLHPKAQRDLVRQLHRIQQTHPELQILVSTHSPYVVDEFKAEDVWVFAPDKEGCAVTKRLNDHPEAKRMLEVLTTGEFWSAEGEPWVLDEEPVARVAEEPHA